MKAEKKSLSEMSIEHKKRVFSAWEKMTYNTANAAAVINTYTVFGDSISMSIKIYADCENFADAVINLIKAFINCQVEYKVYFDIDSCRKKYIHIIAIA